MDITLSIPENSSDPDATLAGDAVEHDNGTMHMNLLVNCTSMDELDPLDVFTMMDIGNTGFWGSVSLEWMTCYIIYCILLYTALLAIFCVCIYLLFYALKQPFSLCSYNLVYLFTSYILWLIFSFTHGILLFVSIISGSERALANGARTSETMSSSIFVGIIIATIFFHPYLNSRFQLKSAVYSTLSIYLMTVVIVTVSLSTSEQKSSDILTVLIGFRAAMFLASTGTVILNILYRNSFNIKKLSYSFWSYKSLLVIAFPYFLLLCSYFLYTLSTVMSNSNCIENVQLHRAVWLVLNLLIRFCEISFCIAHFMKPVIFVKLNFKVTQAESRPKGDSVSCSQSSYLDQPQPYAESSQWRRSLEINYSLAEPKTVPLTSPLVEESEGLSEHVQNHLEKDKPCELEIKQLSCTQNSDSHFDKRNSEVQTLPKSISLPITTDKLHDASLRQSVNSNQIIVTTKSSDITQSNIIDGKAISQVHAMYSYTYVATHTCVCIYKFYIYSFVIIKGSINLAFDFS